MNEPLPQFIGGLSIELDLIRCASRSLENIADEWQPTFMMEKEKEREKE